MKKIIRTLLVVMVLALVISAFTSCEVLDKIKDLINTQPPVTECTHTGGTATCTDKAVCELCGEAYGEALGHTEVVVEAVEATCTTTGLTEGKKCSVCGTVLVPQEEVPTTDHTYVDGKCECGAEDPNYVPPHEHEFVDGKCECGEEDPNYVPPHVNTLVVGENKIVVSGDTLNTAGAPIEWVEFVVEEKAHYEFTGDTYAFVYVRKDLADFTACVCGFSGKADLEPGTYYICIGGVETGEFTITVTKSEIHVHVWSDATCTEPSKCECGETQGEALNHDLVDVAEKAATCEEDGHNAHKACTRCDYTEGKEVYEGGHTLKYTTVLPTADAAGYTTITCEACEAYETVTFAPVNAMGEGTYVISGSDEGLAGTAQGTYTDGEVYVHGGVFEMHLSAKFRVDDSSSKTFPDEAGTFLQGRLNWGGKTQFKENGAIYNGIVFTTTDTTTVNIYWVQGGDDHRQVALYDLAGNIVAQSDDQTSAKNDPCYTTLTVPAGTYVLGNVVNTNYHFRVEVIVAHSHVLSDVEGKSATCTEDGYTAHKACACGYAEGKEVLPAGHTLVDAEGKDATCTEDGYTAHKACENCDYTEGKEVVGATGHSYTDGYCTCGEVDPDYYFAVSISEALAATDGWKVEVSGTVSTINTAWSDSYGNISVTIVDSEGNELYLYRLKTNVALGDVITVKGVMATYNSNRQIAAGATAEITGHDSSYDYTEMSIPDAILADDNTNVIVTGTVVKIGTAYSSSYNNISVTIADENGNQLYLYRLSGGADLALNDIITVKGSMATYNGSRQVAGGTYEEVGTHTCSNYTEATCKDPAACVVCGTAKDDVLSTDHNYVDGICTVCNGVDPDYEGEVVEVATESLSITATSGTYDSTAKTITWTSDNFTFVNAQASSSTAIRTSDSDHFRAYAKSETTISGSKITKVVITCASSSYATVCAGSLTTEGVTATVEGSVVTLTVDSGTVDSIVIGATAQWRLTDVEVTYQK